MANTNVTSYGKVEGIIKNVLMSNGGTETDRYGRFYLDGQMIGVELSRAIAEAIYLNEVYQNGLNCTVKYTDDTAAGGAVRVPLEMPFHPSSRTLTYGGRKGTPGNDGIFNKNAPILPSTDEFIIYNNQINDQDIVFPDIAKAYIPLDLMSRTEQRRLRRKSCFIIFIARSTARIISFQTLTNRRIMRTQI